MWFSSLVLISIICEPMKKALVKDSRHKSQLGFSYLITRISFISCKHETILEE